MRFKNGSELVGDFKHDGCHGQGTITELGDDQSDFHNGHWNNQHDGASIDYNQDLHEIISRRIHLEHEGHIIGTQDPSDYYDGHWDSVIEDRELETALKIWLNNEIPPTGETLEGRWENGDME